MTRFSSRGGAGIDDLVERTLARARIAREPSPADKERVLSSLRDYLDDPTGSLRDSNLNDDGLQDDVVSGVRQIVKEAARPRARRLPRWVRPWAAVPATVQMLVCVSAFAGTLGFWLGSTPEPENPGAATVVASDGRAERSNARARGAIQAPAIEAPPELAPTPSPPPLDEPAAPLESSPTPAVPAAVQPPIPASPRTLLAPVAKPRPPAAPSSAPAPLAAAPLAVPYPLTPSPATPESAPSDPARLAPSAPGVPAARDSAPAAPLPRAYRSLPPPGVAPRPPALLSAPSPLAPSPLAPSQAAPSAREPRMGDPRFLEAVRLVQRAQRSIESGAPSVALSLLDDLDARFPEAMLNEERLATRVLALCASGAVPRARRVAAELRARSPSSIYAARIAQSCAGTGAPAAPRR